VRTIAVINQKGGVGKTTTVANLGAAVASCGRAVCLIDLDPQSHLTLHLGVEPGSCPVSMYDVLTGDADLVSATVRLGEHLWLAPSVIDLAAAEVELVGTVGREQILRDRLAASTLPVELALIDCPPSLGLLTLNALAAADDVIIPLQPHFLALQGLGKLLETVSLVQRRINPPLKVLGVILCLYESTAKLSAEVTDDLRQFLDGARSSATPWSQARIFETVIRRNIKLAECPSYGKTIFDYEPSSHGAEDYGKFAEEFLALVFPSSDVVSTPQPTLTNEAPAPQEPQGAIG
jgi:chromosome partitioning protein